MSASLGDVLGAVVPGRVTRLSLTPEQRASLRDRDAQLGLDVLRHLLGARSAITATPGDRFPLTEATFQAVARKLGHEIGIKRSRAVLHRLVQVDVILPSGSYRQAYRRQGVSGFRVKLRIGAALAPLRRKRPVGRGGAVKAAGPTRWWQHPLFGTLDGRPPPGYSRAQLRRMRSADEREPTWR
jgi:hypothetical protein